jgi:hypothetical protein
MTYNEIVGHYGGLSKAAKALDMSKQRIHAWKRIRIPSDIQIRIAALTGLRADPDACTEIAALAAAAKRASRKVNNR